MINGHVSALHLLVPVRFRLQDKPDVSIEFVVDTGFTGSLSLPQEAVTALGLPFLYEWNARLADDSTVVLPVYEATIFWGGIDLVVHVLASGQRPLLGTELLDGYELTAQFQEGGFVSIEPI